MVCVTENEISANLLIFRILHSVYVEKDVNILMGNKDVGNYDEKPSIIPTH